MARLIWFLLLLTLAVALSQAALQSAGLPPRVATHFDLQGVANGWMPKPLHLGLQLGLYALLGAFFLGIRRVLARVPDAWLRVPHHDYWLAPERREISRAWLAMAAQALGIFVIGFFIFVYQRVYQANLTGTLRLDPVLLIVGQFLFLICLVVVGMFRFQRPPENK